MHAHKLYRYLSLYSLLWCLKILLLGNWDTTAATSYFVANQGQWQSDILYRADVPQGALFIEKNRWTFNFMEAVNMHAPVHQSLPQKGHAYRLHFLGSNSNNIQGEQPLTTYHNYYKGNNKENWATRVPLFEQVAYQRLYPNIQAKIYFNNNSAGLKYDFIVEKGGDFRDIQLLYEGIDNICIENGKLKITTSVNEIVEQEPVAYQIIKGEKKQVPCAFVLRGNVVNFEIAGKYNKKFPLVIDPQVIFSSFTGSVADNWGFTATYDADGDLYAGGIAFGAGYPTTVGAYDLSANDDGGDRFDVAISKFSADGSVLLYSTYLGGNEGEMPHSLIVNNNEQLVVFGTSGSNNFPTTATAYDASFNAGAPVTIFEDFFGNGGYAYPQGSDIFISIFSEDGDNLVGSTLFGGNNRDGMNNTGTTSLEYNYGDRSRGEVIVDANNRIYIATCSNSNNLPTSPFSFQSNKSGAQDAVVAAFNADASALLWCTYLGGNEDDAAYGLKIGDDGSVYVSGGTRSSNFPMSSGFDTNFNGGQADGFLVRLSGNGNNLLNSTFLGTTAYDQAYFVEIDKEDNIYTVGQTRGSYQVTSTYGSVFSNTNAKQFIHKFNTNLTATLFSTTFGSSNSNDVNISPTAFLVDECLRIYVSGWGGEVNIFHNPETGTTQGMPLSGDATQNSTDGSDMYFISLDENAKNLLYGSYFGGSGSGEHVDGGTSRFNKEGIIYQAVCAGCSGTDNFPTTAGSWSVSNNSDNCNLGAVKINFDPNIIYAAALVNPQPTGCVPFTVQFQNLSNRGQQFFWDLGDGTTSTEVAPTHIYNSIDTFLVTLIAVDSNACNIADTVTTQVFVPDSSQVIQTDFSYQLPAKCDPYTVNFDNLSVTQDPLSSYPTLYWTFGDGNFSFERDSTAHTYAEAGTYTASLVINTDFPCFNSDEAAYTFTIPENPMADASFLSPTEGCAPYNATFTAQDDAQQYLWTFSDGGSAEGKSVSHFFENAGTYNIQLISIDSTTCNIADTVQQSLLVSPTPVAFFTFVPDTAYVNQEVQFTNKSTPANGIFFWDFGDGDTSVQVSPIHKFIQVGINVVCLKVNVAGSVCEDIFCDTLYVSDEYTLGVPNAFSPNGDMLNDTLKMQGYGLESVVLKIFNRWGEKVFETDNLETGWDGTYKGEPQEMDVYVYLVEAVLPRGRPEIRKGNITLMR